uniref:C2 domain-containing protein n=1 Tax=Caenorhabditis japonica TaxID=281687 RepID=A0A8R1IYA2_CAEJA
MKRFNLYLESALPYNIQQGSLFINVNRCVELIGMDSTGFSDPYCKVSLTPITSKAHRAKTATKKRTLNPEWNENFSSKTYLPSGILLSTSAKDERGRQWIKCIENPGTLVEAWHRLELDS